MGAKNITKSSNVNTAPEPTEPPHLPTRAPPPGNLISADELKLANSKDAPHRITVIELKYGTKDAPHRIAVIELKYRTAALGGKCGIVKHLKDFQDFNSSKSSYNTLANEIPAILQHLKAIGYDVPPQLNSDSIEISEHIEYYIICLY